MVHRSDRSTTSVRFLPVKRLALLLLVLAWANSCAPSGQTRPQRPVVAASDLSPTQIAEAQNNHQLIVRLTDDVLLSLAARQYQNLAPLLQHTQPPVSPRQFAGHLLGPNFNTICLDRWDAQQIQVTFDREFSRATARAAVTYRLRPGAAATISTFVLRFHRRGPSQPWLLSLD